MFDEKIYLGNDTVNVDGMSTVSVETVRGGELKELQLQHLDRLIAESRAVTAEYRQEIAQRIEHVLNKYAAEIGTVLMPPQAGSGASCPTYRVSGLDMYGNGNAVRISDGASFSVAEHIMPAFETLYQTGSNEPWLVPFLTSGTLQKDTYDVWCEYVDAYGILQFVKKDCDSPQMQAEPALVIRFANGAVKKYPSRYAPFDIHSKKEELERCIAAYRHGWQTWFNQTKAYWYHEVRQQLDAEGVLTELYLTNEEKCAEYEKVRRLCITCLPELADREWDIDLLWHRYPYHYAWQSCSTFKQDWQRINRACFTLNKGAKGERKVGETLRICADSHRIRILENYVQGCEHDFIVITPHGIFTIEVKSVSGDHILTETGYLKRTDRAGGRLHDIGWQSMRHANILQSQLKDCRVFSEAQPPEVKQVLCFADAAEPVTDRYHRITVAYPTTLMSALGFVAAETSAPPSRIFSEDEMDEIEQYLRAHREKAYKYPVFGTCGDIADREAFLHAFADIVSTYKTLQTYFKGHAC